MSRAILPGGPDVALRAVGVALAAVSIAFAGHMLADGGGAVRVLGIEHLAIFAQPRSAAAAAAAQAHDPAPRRGGDVDMGATGSLAEPEPDRPPPRPEILAAETGRVWLRTDRAIVAAAPGQEVAGLGRIGAIVRRDGAWAVLDDKGATLLTLPGGANAAALFSRKLIFD